MEGRIYNHPVITFPERQKVSFTFEGKSLEGYAGEPIAAALHANGIRVLKEHHGRKRGLFCAIGNCSSCLMMVNTVPNVRICVTPLQDGDVVCRQIGQGTIGKAGAE